MCGDDSEGCGVDGNPDLPEGGIDVLATAREHGAGGGNQSAAPLHGVCAGREVQVALYASRAHRCGVEILRVDVLHGDGWVLMRAADIKDERAKSV